MGFAPSGLSTPLEIPELGLQPDARMALQFQPCTPLSLGGNFQTPQTLPQEHQVLQPAKSASDLPMSHAQIQTLVFCLCANQGCTTSTPLGVHMEATGLA